MVRENPNGELSTEEKDHVERSNKKVKTGGEVAESYGVVSNVEARDDTMMVGIEIHHEEQGATYKDKLRGTMAGEHVGEISMADELEEWHRPWMRTLLVKLMGKSLGVAFMKTRIERLWSKTWSVQIIDLENGFFAVTFTSQEDFTHAYQEGPWLIADHYLIVQKWKPNFDPYAMLEKTRIVAWIRVPGLPLEYYNVRCLRRVGDLIRKTLKVDQNTSLTSRGKFARICVEINLKRQLVPQVEICGRNYRVEYEGLHMICFFCGKYRHIKEACCMLKKNQEGSDDGEMRQTGPQKEGDKREGDAGSLPSEEAIKEGTFGPWMTVTKPVRRRMNNPKRMDANMEEQEEASEPNQNGANASRPVLKEITNRRDRGGMTEGGSGKGATKPRDIAPVSSQKQSEAQQGVIIVARPRMPGKAPLATSTPNGKEDRGSNLIQGITNGSSNTGLSLKGKPELRKPPEKNTPTYWTENIDSRMEVGQDNDESTIHMDCEMSSDMVIYGGTGARGFSTLVRDIRSHYKFNFLALVETHQHRENARRIINRMGFTHSEVVEANGHAGGIWCMWSENGFTVQTLVKHEQLINFRISSALLQWYFIVVYGKPQLHLRGNLWSNLDNIGASMQDPWCITGDFNAFVDDSKKFGGSLYGSRPDMQFIECISRNCLIDLRYSGAGTHGREDRWRLDWIERCLMKHGGCSTPKLRRGDRVATGRKLSTSSKRKLILGTVKSLKSRAQWIIEGDCNTRFFHTTTLIRRKRNKIEALRDDHGNYSDPGITGCFPTVPEDELEACSRMITMEELREAIFSMGPFKSPGPDGLNPVFFQSQWGIVSSSVYDMVRSIYQNPVLIEHINHTLIVLVPKTARPECLKDLRPISLCNVIYKAITKVLANRIKGIMPLLVATNQCSFVPERHSTDNVVVIQEVVHSMRCMKGKKGLMAIKIDLEKAYDRISWDFVVDTLKEVGFGDTFMNLIHHCLITPSLQILWNGGKTDSFKPSRGIRQGDPISPYLFVLCIERLAHIQRAIGSGDWRPIKLGREGPPISHLFFADDLVIFLEASMNQVDIVKRVLNDFCSTSGQKVNKNKARVFFSKNVGHTRVEELSQALGFEYTGDLRSYLGVPILHQRVNKSTYNYILKSVRNKLSSWKSNCLSLAGRATLVKSVTSAIHVYSMQSSVIPSSVCSELEKINRSFLWGSTTNQRRMHMVAWEKVCTPKSCGGLGMRHIKEQKNALIMKLGWGLVEHKDSLWAQVLRGKYRCGKDTIPKTLKEVALGPLTMQDLEAKLNEFLTPSRGWDWSRFEHLLPDDIFLKLSCAMPPNASRSEDRVAWRFSKDARKRRNLTDCDLCPRCQRRSEDLMHTLRDCDLVRTVWMRLVNPCHWQIFFDSNMVEWLEMNLHRKLGRYAKDWSVVFATACWHIWKARNTKVFDHRHADTGDPVMCILQTVRRTDHAFESSVVYKNSHKNRTPQLILWQKPPTGWVKVNVDGARKEQNGIAACGRVVRDDNGSFVAGFMKKLDDCSILAAELWGIACGLEVAWDMGFRRVSLEADSLTAITMVQNHVEDSHPCANLIHKIHSWLSQDWEVSISHVFREGNRLANEIAKRAIHSETGFKIFHEQDNALARLLHEGSIGVGTPINRLDRSDEVTLRERLIPYRRKGITGIGCPDIYIYTSTSNFPPFLLITHWHTHIRETLELEQKDMAMEEEIKAEFRKSGFGFDDEEEILKKCLPFCINYSLKPSDLVSSWEVYYLNRQLNEPTVQSAEMDGFLLHLQNEQKEAVIKEEIDLHIYSSRDVEIPALAIEIGILNNDDDVSKDNAPGTPTDHQQDLYSPAYDSTSLNSGNILHSGKSPKLVTPFSKRTNKFDVKFSINNMPDLENGKQDPGHENDEDDIVRKIIPRKRCSLMVHESGPKSGCRFMYDKIEDRFNALENRIKKHTRALVASGLYEEPMDPIFASQRSIFTVGMICCDGEGRLNEKSVMLQSSTEHSGGQRVRLELQQLSHFSVFPGQIVGIQGHNPSGHCLVASKLVDSVPSTVVDNENLNPAKKPAFDKDNQTTDLPCKQRELSMIVAAGPFTTTDNLLFEPLAELLAYAKKRQPQLIVLLGPFIDTEHPDIKKGTTDRSFDEIFHVEILRRLEDYVECMGSAARVLLVPSIRDANHDLVFPQISGPKTNVNHCFLQPAFDINLPNIKPQIASLTNPGIFEANESVVHQMYTVICKDIPVKVGCCTVDILKQLSGEEISRISADGKPSDRMSRVANHILKQRSFYPLYPPAENVPLDFSLASEALQLSMVPDVLILPSDIKYFVKVLHEESEEGNQMKCISINPGRLAKGEGGGTFAELDFYGGPDTINASIVGI
ncbi:DNA polymerase alpha subunit B [Senna tora]|uniref:DNA polymerase alpha subunit B n=1 Tax=Senna tora TaxID=362788 RepID=A0A835CF35_9FABA|nr:DNA polymerase alpha subunit B [Senna tora]